MKHKKIRASILTGYLALGVIGLFNSLGQRGFLPGVIANPLTPAYKRTLIAGDGPGVAAPLRGVVEIKGDNYYYATASAQSSDQLMILSATDAKNPGVLMNITVINGIAEVKATFTGSGNLYALVTATLFERFAPTAADGLTSGVTKEFATVGGYLLLMTDSLNPISIASLEICFHCNGDNDAGFFFEPGVNAYTGARSLGSNIAMTHNGLSFTTNPTATTHNYSGETAVPPATRANSWYRWNGVTMRNYKLDGENRDYSATRFGNFFSSSFEVSVTAFVDPVVFYDADEWFCVAPWMSLSVQGDARTPRAYLQSYIGNDNYDPLTTVNTLHQPYWSGRFFTNYTYDAADAYPDDYIFQDPDTFTVIDDASTTLRAAYEAINLPFFNVTFQISGNTYKIFINGFWVYTDTILSTYTDEAFGIETFDLQAVNYGNADGSPKAGYAVTYSNPVVKTI
ncbi:MAG: hypothetical protein ACOX3K_03580 [Bacilli bacterium]|jgi:hypothetical protein